MFKKKILLISICLLIINCSYSQIPNSITLGDIETKGISYKKPIIGKNYCSFFVVNKSDSVKNIFIPNRVECSFWNRQSGKYYSLKAKEVSTIRAQYYLEDETCFILKVFFHIPDKIQIYPGNDTVIRSASESTKVTYRYK